MLQGRQMVPIQPDSITVFSAEAAGWAQQIDIRPDIEMERF